MLVVACVAAASVKDLYAPFPRPTAAQALTQLAAAAARSAESGDPEDALDAYGGRSEWLTGFEAEVAAALGKERALFFPTGVAAQNAMDVQELETELQRPVHAAHTSQH